MSSNRAVILNLIKSKRHILFGRNTNKITNELKMQTWEEIFKKGCEMGILDQSKGWQYFRDIVWQNWKKRSLNRVNGKRPTRLQEQKKSGLNEIDMTVLDIVNTEASAGAQDAVLSLDDSSESDSNETVLFPLTSANNVHSRRDSRDTVPYQFSATISSSSIGNSSSESISLQPTVGMIKEEPIAEKQRPNKRKRARTLSDKQILEKMILKTRLQVLEKESYLKDIEIYKKEKELGLPHSKYTRKFYQDLNSSTQSDGILRESNEIRHKKRNSKDWLFLYSSIFVTL